MSSSTITPPSQPPPQPTAAAGIRQNDPARTGFDPKTQWWVNYFNILCGRVTPEGQFHYREWRERENEARDCRRCEDRRQVHNTVRGAGGGFSPDHGIRICANNLRDRKHLEDSLAHEMVHAWDHLRWKVDFGGRRDLKHAACTEIRASMLSGECRWTRETFTRGHWTLTQQFQNCVRSRAIQSVMARPTCKDKEHASKVVNQVWDSCFADTRPFDEVYR
ncbi:metalloprotease ATP23 [Magnaporthiopsis poae ATCC 64411]|uniref:Mitochondrial inner membrane protease ATP23 n=1 Tax=Magnaporthiopsis poae (strain ATCC 64411 / 73-15) TaxID=644358 RepID=A0A0C4E2J1_MAGP6|nr:metalloprotease ATP23 [Magnaporthiopsis poae ATCC 64411]